ncbi:uncharacterized protein LOC116221494 isoform X3 [Clupea harengus]|uniref:Uncharacterized protein LOC116221494 isoform X3 n=1 Tax=Clupea harengus TaxID=7950 RepID=A0A6P8FX57_CLUHA|nr:uncharacterized protein LOC116221494 isoform X3 [Clupea harengus]
MGLRAGLNRYLCESPLSWCLVKDREFMSSNDLMDMQRNSKEVSSSQCTTRTSRTKISLNMWRAMLKLTSLSLTAMGDTPYLLRCLWGMWLNPGRHQRPVLQLKLKMPKMRRLNRLVGNPNPSPVESITPASPCRPTTDDEHVPFLTESQMMDRVRARALQAGRVGRPGARGPGP